MMHNFTSAYKSACTLTFVHTGMLQTCGTYTTVLVQLQYVNSIVIACTIKLAVLRYIKLEQNLVN